MPPLVGKPRAEVNAAANFAARGAAGGC